jgi:arabinose-5-phosphate isomerase
LLAEADIALLVPDVPEASPTGAPTTSTTQMLALGDALAMALLERRGFTQADFHVFHPGGKLGTALLHVRELMHPVNGVAIVAPEDSMSRAMIEVTAKGYGCAGVVDAQGRLVGIITDGDLRRHMGADLLSQPTGAVMTRTPVTVSPGMLAAEALRLMNEKRITSLFVVEDAKPVGLVHVHDMLRAGVI